MPTTIQKWRKALGLSIAFTICSYWYLLVDGVQVISIQALSFVLAAVASLLFAVAFSIGGVSYYTGWINVRSGYQKQIGILAFYFACIYCLTLLILYPEIYVYRLADNFFSADILLGSLAMSIFALMVVINTKFIAKYISFETIKFVLGLGYVGYGLLVMRAILIEFDVWVEWFLIMDTLPPGRMVLSIIAVAVLLLRISIPVHKKIQTV